jgi:hypothetical protein
MGFEVMSNEEPEKERNEKIYKESKEKKPLKTCKVIITSL